jgi:hypothetical protein
VHDLCSPRKIVGYLYKNTLSINPYKGNTTIFSMTYHFGTGIAHNIVIEKGGDNMKKTIVSIFAH